MATIYVTTDIPFQGFTSELGYWLWNSMMVGIPYDTGNLRSSFKMPMNSQKKIKYIFDDTVAYYVDYLEEGIGFVTKHKDFIKEGLMNIATQELIYFIKTGKTGLIISKPNVVLRKSVYSNPIGYERRILNYLDTHAKHITATDRKQLSGIMYRSLEDKNTIKMSGEAPNLISKYKRKDNLNLDMFYISDKEYLTNREDKGEFSIW